MGERKTFREWSEWWTANLPQRLGEGIQLPAGFRFPTAAEVGTTDNALFTSRELEAIVEPWMELRLRALGGATLNSTPGVPTGYGFNSAFLLFAIVAVILAVRNKR